MKWLEALKKWNNEKNTGKWKIPKKDTKEYLEVKSIMNGTTSTKKEKKTKGKKAKTKTKNKPENPEEIALKVDFN